MKNRFSTLVILITAAVWAGFAVWLGLQPIALLTAFGIENSTPQMLTEVRAFYGGVELAVAVAMMVLWRRGELVAALLIGGLPLVGSACGRCFGLVFDGFSTMHASFVCVELTGAAFCFAGYLVTQQEKTE